MNPGEARSNPLVPVVLELLQANADEGISEHELLKALERRGLDFASAADPDLRLFQRHFLLMNALYQLQDLLWREERVWLCVSPLRIAIERVAEQASVQAVGAAADSALRNYYLDWRELEKTDAAAVANLLEGFWQRFHALDRRAAALATLQLDASADWDEIRNRYRKLAAATHPDRGGDGAEFLAVREAFEILRVAAQPR